MVDLEVMLVVLEMVVVTVFTCVVIAVVDILSLIVTFAVSGRRL